MSDNVSFFYNKKGDMILSNRADGSFPVIIKKGDVAEVILWLASFQQGVQPTVTTVAPPEVESNPRNSG